MIATITTLPAPEGVRLSESVYDSLLEAILTGQLKAGEPVSELALTRSLGVSRTPVHEAIRQLIHDGLVVQQANCRPIVSRFSSADVHEVFEMRIILEGEATSRAADRMDRQTLTRLRSDADHLLRLRRSASWIRRWADFDELFHSAIATASGMRRLAKDIGQYRRLHRFFNKVHTTYEVLQQALAEHIAILDALARRDAEGARHAMTTHIREWQRFFIQQLEQQAAPK